MPKIVKRKDNPTEHTPEDPKEKGGVFPTEPGATPSATPAPQEPTPLPYGGAPDDPSIPSAQPEGIIPEGEDAIRYPYHDALAHFPKGAVAAAALAQNAAVDADQVIAAVISGEYSRTEEMKDAINFGVPGEVTAMTAAAALVGESIPGLEHIEVPPIVPSDLNIDPGLADMQGIIKRAHATFADAIDEFAVEVQLNQINQGDI